MGASIFLFLFLFFVSFSFQSSIVKATNAGCHAPKCSVGGPDIRYPFHIKSHKPQNDSLPGFELFCKGNLTTIHFQSYGDLVVKSISYDTRKIYLLDPKNCVHGVFLNLSLSLTPFHYYHVLKNYTYLSCSETLSPPNNFIEVPCLSGSGSHVYTVEPAMKNVPGSCKGFKTVAIPFKYSPYLSDNSFGLEFTWDFPESGHNKARNQTTHAHAARYTVIGFSICLLLVAITLISVKAHGSTRNCGETEGRLLQSSPYV